MKKNKHIISIFTALLIVSFILPITAYAANLSCWESDVADIAKWESSPTIWYSKMDPSASFALVSGLTNGASIWNKALGTSVTVYSGSTSAEIRYYGGTKAQIDALNLFDPVPSNYYGLTVSNLTYGGTHIYSGSIKNWYTINSVIGYVVSRSDMDYDNYVKTGSHEVGHAMGWLGHPATEQTTWVMQPGKLTNSTLSTSEAKHLSQIY